MVVWENSESGDRFDADPSTNPDAEQIAEDEIDDADPLMIIQEEIIETDWTPSN